MFNEISFNQSIDEDYYKPIRTKSTFNDNYIVYESEGDKDKNSSHKKYLNMIKPYLPSIINDHKAHGKLKVPSGNKIIDYKTTALGKWKIQLKMSINFTSSKDDSDEICIMSTKSDNIEIIMGSETDEIIEELFESLLQNHQKDLEESMKQSGFNFDSVDLLYYHLQKTSLSRKGGSYINSPKMVEK